MTEPCPCDGKHASRDWHRNRGLDVCDTVRAQRAESQRNRAARLRKDPTLKQAPTAKTVRIAWQPGTSIFVDDDDPL